MEVSEVDMENVRMISNLTSCNENHALTTYLGLGRDVIATIDAILEKPVVSGEKYIPKKPTIDSGLSEEQLERCKKGRDLQDKVNAVFSVAHSKIRNQPDHEVHEASEVSLPSLAPEEQ